MTIHEMPVKWDAIQFLPDESVWMIPRSTYQGYEIVIAGQPNQPDPQLLEFAKRVIDDRERWTSLSRGFLWDFMDRSKFPPADEDWYADAFRFESPDIFTIEFSHVADPYGLWIVELHQSRLREEDPDSYAVQEFRRRNH
ncbi:hypothetical protein [Sulfuriroseicoccus oceanibius]|uniref:Uncharacterized protein n=1 Tax=Sulfuriroseicoccus oceanibius TaxID=2707525 RepID=A0A6B3LFW2_9BACT|nr:hypothetical protein [Sulfuriroseicoccus oceanibius]QQL44052.1 hypothetical protein G3M56_009115 [Sulfuriroseicoccus oceanibius]